MKKEAKYFLAIVSLFIALILALIALLKKYAWLTLAHFIETCQQIASTFLSSGVHFVGLALVTTTILIITSLFIKSIFSYLKTQKKINRLLKQKTTLTPKKLNQILDSQGIDKKDITVIKSSPNQAITAGFFYPKIIISTGLIKRLPDKQLESVILHESYHLKNKHSLLLIVGEIISSSLFFLPLLKELAKAMKVVLEKEADRFVVLKQKTDSHLKLALTNVTSNKTYFFYSGFSQRREHKVNRASISLSLLTLLFMLGVLLLPTESHASQMAKSMTIVPSCSQNTCSTPCLTKDLSQKVSYNF